jgi:hypothetical protein
MATKKTATPKKATKAAPKGDSKLAQFLTAKKIDARRLLATSSSLEKLRPEDRAIRLARKNRKEGDKKAEGEVKRPRSGRPITNRGISAALTGKKISGPQKTRILKAVNALLAAKKQDPATLDLLF